MTQELKFKIIPQYERYYSEDSGWGVYTFITEDDIPEYSIYIDDIFGDKVERKQSILCGNMQQLYLGSEYEITANLSYNNKYKNYQYVPSVISTTIPKTQEQQKKFLESLVTEKQAITILEKYPNVVEDIIKNVQIDIKELKGIGEYSWNIIKDRILDNYVISDILIMLQPLGVTYKMIKKLLSNEPNPTLLKEKLLNNPYIMTEIKGLGFKTVDSLALKINPNIKISKKRTYAFLSYYLKEIGNTNGHTWVHEQILENAVRDNIYDCLDIYNQIIENEKEEQKNKNNVFLIFKEEKVGLKKYYDIEIETVETLKYLNSFNSKFQIDIQKGIKEAEKELGFELTDEQKNIVKKASQNNVAIISGKAGSGKSTISRALLKAFSLANCSISCAALSAKAAQRITEATGFPASTIHRMLGVNTDPTSNSKFLHNHNNPLFSDVILVDEGSMVNASIFHSLVQAIKEGSRIIICGDDRQLPPIGYGNIFSDLLNMKDIFNVNQLTKVLRQAEKSGILADANKIRDGVMPISHPELKIVSGELQDMVYMFRENKEGLRNLAIKAYLSAVKTDGLDDVIIITPRKNNCINSTFEINQIIQNELISDEVEYVKYGNKIFKLGAKVIQRVNNYDKTVFNGEIGYITKIWEEKEGKDKKTKIEIEFKLNNNQKQIQYGKNELDQIDLAYALTVHKCLPRDTYIYTDKGLVEINKLDKDIPVQTIQEIDSSYQVYNGQFLEKPSHFYNAGISDCKEIITERGYSLTATYDHSINVLDENFNVIKKHINDLSINDCVLISKGQNIYGDNVKIPNTTSNITSPAQAKIYSLPTTITNEFARFLGYMVADGTLFQKGFRLSKRYLQLVEDFKYVTDITFGTNYNIQPQHHKYEYTVYSTYLSKFLNHIGGLKPHNKYVPDIILQAPKHIQCEFLKAVFEDGTVNIKNKKFDHIELSMKNKKMQKQISLMLLNMGIVCTLDYRNKQKHPQYVIYIYKEYADIFYKNIGFIVNIKNDRLKLCIAEKYKNQKKSIPNIKKSLHEIVKKYHLPLQIANKYNLRINEPLRGVTSNMFYKFYNSNPVLHNDIKINFIKNIIENYYIDKIKNIKTTKVETVCITMPETHQFIQDGFSGWNCQGSGYKTVIALIDNTHYVLLDTCLLYTALTRAKKRCLLLAEPSAFKKCICNNNSVNRQTWLKEININKI